MKVIEINNAMTELPQLLDNERLWSSVAQTPELAIKEVEFSGNRRAKAIYKLKKRNQYFIVFEEVISK